MKNSKLLILFIVILILAFAVVPASAQTYRFTVSEYEIEAYLESDGTLTLRYLMVFMNDSNADPIDFVDLGLPIAEYEYKNIDGTIDGQPIPKIGPSAYVRGAELALQKLAIQPGQSGEIIVTVSTISGILFPYDQPDRENYVNFQFTPSYFGSEYDKSTATKYRMTIVLPPGVDGDSGVYYTPSGWPGSDAPKASFTTDGRVYYSWYTENADVHSEYSFGVAFPSSAVPADSISSKEVYIEEEQESGGSGGFWDFFGGSFPCCIGVIAIVGFGIYGMIQGTKNAKKRKLQYMPPKISIEGQGIKRGLTAVEAGILMEEPLDKVLTMVLFGLLKKDAVTVLEKEPLRLQASDPLPEGLFEYETSFLEAFETEKIDQRKAKLQSTIIDLVKSVSEKMKGFSKKETVAYYKSIIERAWTAVETAQTPEIKSAQYDHTLEWTMLDDDFNKKTEQTFTGRPVIVPHWWPRYDPFYRPTVSGSGGLGQSLASKPSTPSGAGGSKPSLSLPHIPGSDFAASMVNGASTLAAGAIGDLTSFTGGITNKTNPIPVSTTSTRSGSGGFRGGGGGGHSCACACACAGCACACAGGGR